MLAVQPPHLIREVLMDVRRQQGWPLVAMGFAEWESLAAMISAAAKPSVDGPRKRMFPGAILAGIPCRRVEACLILAVAVRVGPASLSDAGPP